MQRERKQKVTETARVRENRLPSGVRIGHSNVSYISIPPNNSREPGMPDVSAQAGPKVDSVTGSKL